MIKNCTLVILLLTGSIGLFADEFEKNYGNGVVHFQIDSISSVEFYSAPNGKVIHNMHITRNAWSIDRIMVTFDRLIDSFPSWFAPEYFITHGEYARLDIKAIDSTDGFYRTILRDSANQEIWIKKQKHVYFLSWLGFYNSVSSIEPISDIIILYDKPDPKSKAVNYSLMMNEDERGFMAPLEIKGQWMKVEIHIPEQDPLLSWKTYTGWIKWRDDKQPLIAYNLMGC